MKLKTVVKLGTMASVLLFVMAIGYYAFVRFEMAEHNRDIDLFLLVPSNSVGVLDSDNVNALFNEYPTLNYNHALDEFQFPGLFGFLMDELSEHEQKDAHGLSGQMNRLLVSFHHPGTLRDQVVYFRMGMADEQMLSDILQDYMPENFLLREEVYRGKSMKIYPLSHDEFMVTYAEKGFMVLSYQKRLIEEVIDAYLDNTALGSDEVFSEILAKKKSHDFLTLYGRTAPMPFGNMGSECWSEYDFHMNSDVVYLTGDTYSSQKAIRDESLQKYLAEIPVVREEGLIISAQTDSTVYYMEEAFEANEKNRTLFNECVANLSNGAAFSLVVDMEKVKENPDRFQSYLPPFVLRHIDLFRPFILSVQLSFNGERPSHIWVFTYKN